MAPKPDGDVEMAEGEVEKKEPEAPKELETDAKDVKPVLKAGQCCFNTEDTTMNVMQTVNGKLLMALGDGGMQYLLAGAKGSVGIKGGRYMFEVMIAEAKTMQEPQGRVPGPKPKQLVRVGVSTAESSLILGAADNTDSVCFDSGGYFHHGKKKELVSKKFGHSQVAALLVNLDASSPNANTVSLFINGARVSQPQPLPESLKGKVLYPTVTYRNVSLQVNFGAAPLRPLPFKCHTWLHAQKAHSEVKAPSIPKDGKHEVLLPVGLPDEGTFDWVDQFLAKNKNYTELSDRAILDWASKSGLQRQGGYAKRTCNDKPEMSFGLTLMDDYSVSKVLKVVAKTLPRNFIVAEVKNNLLPEQRQKTLASFPSHCYKKVVQVMVGQPPADFKKYVQEVMLAEKQAKADAEVQRKKAEAAKKKLAEEQRKKREEERKKRIEEIKKAREARAAKAKEGKEGEKEDGEGATEEKVEEKAEEETKEKEEEKAEESKEEEIIEDVKAELTAEEKKLSFRKKDTPDLSSKDMSATYDKFTLPSKEEGCDDLKFLWQTEAKSQEYLKKWVLERKMTQRVEDIQPGEWFRSKWNEWSKLLNAWKRKQAEFKDPVRRKAALLAKKRAEAAKKAAEEKKEAAEAKEGEDAEKKEEAEEGSEKAEEKKDENKEEKAPEEPEPMDVDVDTLDPFEVEDIADVGNGQPLFSNFTFEDWMLLGLRFELHLLCHAFRLDLDDPERTSFMENHLAFYYNKYFKRQFNIKNFGVETSAELVELVKDSVTIADTGAFVTQISDDTPLDNFMRLTEDYRRERQLRIESGDEAAQLKFQRPSAPAAAGFQGNGAQGGKGASSKGAPAAQGKGGYAKGGHPGYGAPQKRPYAESAPYAASKAPRTGAYGGGAYGGGAPQPAYGGGAPRYGSPGGGYAAGGYSAYSRR